jgi:hypothetical protein
MSDSDICANCHLPKSTHVPYTVENKSRPLGLEPTGWVCQNHASMSSSLTTFKSIKQNENT